MPSLPALLSMPARAAATDHVDCDHQPDAPQQAIKPFLKWECVPCDVSVDDARVIEGPALASCFDAILKVRESRPSEPKWAPLEFKQKQVSGRRVVKWKPPSNDEEVKEDVEADISALSTTDIAIRCGQRLVRPAIPRRLDEDVLFAHITKLAQSFPTHFGGSSSMEEALSQWKQWRDSHPRRIADVQPDALPIWSWPSQAGEPSVQLPQTLDALAHNYRGSIAYINLFSGNRSMNQMAARIQEDNSTNLAIAEGERVFLVPEGGDLDPEFGDKSDTLPLWMAEVTSKVVANVSEGLFAKTLPPCHSPLSV
jgi:hypothetical protein